MVVATIQLKELVKLETEHITVPVISVAIVGVTAVLMLAPVRSMKC